LEINNKKFNVEFVQQFVERTGNISARLRWFETFAAHCEFYLYVAKPLLSMRTAGS
jgi:hypothetical protein